MINFISCTTDQMLEWWSGAGT